MFIFRRSFWSVSAALAVAAVGFAMQTPGTSERAKSDRQVVAALDTSYQAAVARNDADTMAEILHADFALVLGDGRTFSRTDLLESARRSEVIYERQEEDPGTQVVRVAGDTAIVTARLWLKGTRAGSSIERRLWFSDTYVRTASGWRYLFGQASLPLDAGAQRSASSQATASSASAAVPNTDCGTRASDVRMRSSATSQPPAKPASNPKA